MEDLKPNILDAVRVTFGISWLIVLVHTGYLKCLEVWLLCLSYVCRLCSVAQGGRNGTEEAAHFDLELKPWHPSHWRINSQQLYYAEKYWVRPGWILTKVLIRTWYEALVILESNKKSKDKRYINKAEGQREIIEIRIKSQEAEWFFEKSTSQEGERQRTKNL